MSGLSIDDLPPIATYDSREDVRRALNSWAFPRGYAFVTRSSDRRTIGARQTVTFACDRCKPFKPHSQQNEDGDVRGGNRPIRANDCPFSILAVEHFDVTGKSTWKIKYRSLLKFHHHNHPPSRGGSVRPAHRRLSKNAIAEIEEMRLIGCAPRTILHFVQDKYNPLATIKDIHNRLADLRAKASEGLYPAPSLMRDLPARGYFYKYTTDSMNRLDSIVYANPQSLEYLKAYPETVILDGTYKTNRYVMLNIVGVDACEKTFTIAFAFSRGDSEQDFTWVLTHLKRIYETHGISFPATIVTDCCLPCINAIENTFSSSGIILCISHANKAVSQNCKRAFLGQEGGWEGFNNAWHLIINSPDIEAYDRNLASFEREYSRSYYEQVSYVKRTWLNPHKKKLVKAWIDQHLHFGHKATSRVEGSQAGLRKYIGNSSLDIFEVWGPIQRYLKDQLHELYCSQIGSQEQLTPNLRNDLFVDVITYVSRNALQRVFEQKELLNNSSYQENRCTGVFTRTYGLPCVHTLRDFINSQRSLRLEDFHTRWHLMPLISPPHSPFQPTSRTDPYFERPSLPSTSTWRELSGSELKDRELAASALGRIGPVRQRASPRCSRCHTVGHRINTKVCPLRDQPESLNNV